MSPDILYNKQISIWVCTDCKYEGFPMLVMYCNLVLFWKRLCVLKFSCCLPLFPVFKDLDFSWVNYIHFKIKQLKNQWKVRRGHTGFASSAGRQNSSRQDSEEWCLSLEKCALRLGMRWLLISWPMINQWLEVFWRMLFGGLTTSEKVVYLHLLSLGSRRESYGAVVLAVVECQTGF